MEKTEEFEPFEDSNRYWWFMYGGRQRGPHLSRQAAQIAYTLMRGADEMLARMDRGEA